ncbi:hypothetical protein [Paenibacillus sp. V4I7]|uniref:hypothetical protein n=1 Tax=Paenibacillus sp. V4I7 TaxID=3042307 RepID=UPI00278A584D|nr:hypothetical protein [Paenibacillus sp. V4I7]MDQ0902333.1 hypothetical protein [Paenibacillus sp. V4I7]
MPTISKKPFDQEFQTILSELQSGYHAGVLSKKESSERPNDVYLIEVENTMVGYAGIQKAEG